MVPDDNSTVDAQIEEPGTPDEQVVEVSTPGDAAHRALRTFLQGLGIDLVVALGLLLLPIFGSAGSFSELDGKVILFSLTKTVVQTVLSYILRRFNALPSTL